MRIIMLCIYLKTTNPYFCLAAEEYLLKNFADDIFLLWQSEKAVVVGKHQNLLGEINYPYVRENNIVLARRISGGGTVFHDAGNVNFSFIKNVKSPGEISFKQFTAPIVEALAKLGIVALNSGRNDLLVDGLKISGNAEHIFKNRVLHHGTLLFNSDLKNLGQALKVVPGKYESKAVQSKRSPVANITSFLKKEMEIDDFIRFLLIVQLEKPDSIFYELNDADRQSIENLANEKFRTWDWNFGYSPKYSFKNEVEIEGRVLKIELEVVKGIIQKAAISANNLSKKECDELSGLCENQQHHYDDLLEVVKTAKVVSPDFIDAFF